MTVQCSTHHLSVVVTATSRFLPLERHSGVSTTSSITTHSSSLPNISKRGNFLPYAEIPIGMALQAMAHHDNFRFWKMRDSNVNPPRGAAALEPVVPMSDSDNFNDEIDLRGPALPAAMDTSAPSPPTLPIPVSRPSTTGSAPVPTSPPPTSTEFKQPRVSRGRTKS